MQVADDFILHLPVVDAVGDVGWQLVEVLQFEFVIILLVVEHEEHLQAACFKLVFESWNVLHGMGGRLAALVKDAEDIEITACHLQDALVFIAFGIVKSVFRIKVADDAHALVRFAQNEIDVGGFAFLDGEELAVLQHAAITQAGAGSQNVETCIQSGWVVEWGEGHAVVNAGVFGIVGEEVETAAVEFLDTEMGVIFRVLDAVTDGYVDLKLYQMDNIYILGGNKDEQD